MNVSAVLVTRGDVLLQPILKSLPPEWEVVIWNNGLRRVAVPPKGSRNVYDDKWMKPIDDLSVFGRYAAIKHASGDLIYVQDDDVVVSDPQAIVRQWGNEFYEWPGLVANMPPEFRHDGYTDSCLVGFGACFHRDAPQRAFDQFGAANGYIFEFRDTPMWRRTCDVVFTTLTPRVLVDVPKQNLPYATDSTRMYRQPGHLDERTRMLHLARQVRDS